MESKRPAGICSTMLLGAYDDARNDRAGPEDLFSRSTEALVVNADLRSSLEKQRLATASSRDRLTQLTDDLRQAAEDLVETAHSLASLGDDKIATVTLIRRCKPNGRLRPVNGHERLAKQSLARMAAQLAGRDPEQRVTIELAGLVAFDGEAWRYPDFVERAERAFAELAP